MENHSSSAFFVLNFAMRKGNKPICKKLYYRVICDCLNRMINLFKRLYDERNENFSESGIRCYPHDA